MAKCKALTGSAVKGLRTTSKAKTKAKDFKSEAKAETKDLEPKAKVSGTPSLQNCN